MTKEGVRLGFGWVVLLSTLEVDLILLGIYLWGLIR